MMQRTKKGKGGMLAGVPPFFWVIAVRGASFLASIIFFVKTPEPLDSSLA
jgi:hypothetical protein